MIVKSSFDIENTLLNNPDLVDLGIPNYSLKKYDQLMGCETVSEVVYERIKKNLEILNMKNTSLILDNYLEKAIHDKKNIVEILDYLLSEEAKTKKNRAVEN